MAMIIYRTPLSSFLTNSFPLLSLSRQEMSQFVVVFGKKYWQKLIFGSELQKSADRADQSVLILPGRC